MPTLFLKLSKTLQRENCKFIDFEDINDPTLVWRRSCKYKKLLVQKPCFTRNMDCAVEVDRSVDNVIIDARLGECTARFWSDRSLSNHHMARHQGCLWVEPLPCGLRVYAGEPRLLQLRTSWLLPGIVTSSSSGLVSQCWEWMAASHTFSCFPWGNLYNAWQAHTVVGHRPRAVHRIPALGRDRLTYAWRDRPIEAVLWVGTPQCPWCRRSAVPLYWWACLATLFPLSYAGNADGTDRACG